MTSTTLSHPVFARCFNRLSWLLERDAAAHRRRMLAGASGRVVEIGAGNGINFRHYPTTVEEVVALEPESYLRARPQSAARDAPVPVSVADGVADELPLEDGHCDTAVASLCSVPDPPGALAELRRVLRPDAQYLEELYVVPNRRRQGIGRALMEAAIDVARHEGAADMSVGTGEEDVAARALYESLGFSNRESNGALNFFYEREL